jgi:hypothetical protein
MPTLPTLIQHTPGIPSQSNKARRRKIPNKKQDWGMAQVVQSYQTRIVLSSNSSTDKKEKQKVQPREYQT